MAKLMAQLAARRQSLGPGDHQRVADAATMGVLLVAPQGRVGSHRPAQGKVGMSVGAADILDARDLLAVANHLETTPLRDDAVNRAFADRSTTRERSARMTELLTALHGRIDLRAARDILRDRSGRGGARLPPDDRRAIDAGIATHAVIANVTRGLLYVAEPPAARGESAMSLPPEGAKEALPQAEAPIGVEDQGGRPVLPTSDAPPRPSAERDRSLRGVGPRAKVAHPGPARRPAARGRERAAGCRAQRESEGERDVRGRRRRGKRGAPGQGSSSWNHLHGRLSGTSIRSVRGRRIVEPPLQVNGTEGARARRFSSSCGPGADQKIS